MKLDKIVAVSGLPGLYKIVGNRKNGLIIEDMDNGKRRFAPSRNHNFTPLESLSIYTDDGESVALSKVFQRMIDMQEDMPPVDPKSEKDTLFGYLVEVLPNYDRDQVYPNDVKKLLRWFGFLQTHNMLGSDEEE